jgi:hypothetical protein
VALAEYECRRRPLVEEKQAVGGRAAGTFLPQTRRALLLRRVFLRAASLPGIDRLLAFPISRQNPVQKLI